MARKSTTKSSKRPKPKSPTGTPAPRYMRGKKPKSISMHKIADVLAVIEKHGHGKKFKRQLKAAAHTIALHPKTVNFIKDFLAKNNMYSDKIGRKAIDSDGEYDCG